ncbi:MAG: hypothetical protein CR984_01690 [Proteobacteria bacterium]|nr:MAG: hypothetical protein CR984_01690 [Pseudomonadota bacterium]PIE67416.1 MAG: hypothetical protein CSA23_03990 [Deltaproteobacteria bacterium]
MVNRPFSRLTRKRKICNYLSQSSNWMTTILNNIGLIAKNDIFFQFRSKIYRDPTILTYLR